jgi:hypothetical protein
MTMPNFLIIGVGRGGTTSLYYYLKQRPQIYMSPIKKTNFFAYEGGDLDPLQLNELDRRLFPITSIEAYLLDGSCRPGYIEPPSAFGRIGGVNGLSNHRFHRR